MSMQHVHIPDFTGTKCQLLHTREYSNTAFLLRVKLANTTQTILYNYSQIL